MKNYKKGLLTAMILSAMSLMAAEQKTIYVNTFDDEDNTNPNKCSLREAIKAASLNKAYGGCSAGNTTRGQKDYIQLEEGEYILNSELTPESEIYIYGKLPGDYSTKDVLTNEYPARQNIKTKISAKNASRIFNTINQEPTLSLYNVTLDGGASGEVGGALLIGGSLNMTNSAILNSTSAKDGGAIYFVAHRPENQITLDNTLIQGNNANEGSVIAMDCMVNLGKTNALININNSSIIENGSATSLSSIDVCGSSKVAITASTIAKNTANSNNGSIIRIVNTPDHRLSPSSQLSLSSNTIVENNAHSTLYYDNTGNISLNFNILAYNLGKSCRYALNNGDLTGVKREIYAYQNALQLNPGTGQCDLPAASTAGDTSSNININLGSTSMSTILSPYQAASKYNLFLPMYYPIDNQNDSDLVNVGKPGCSTTDQRNLARIADSTHILDPDQNNTCDIGSIERMRLTAPDITTLSNRSYTTLIADYQKKIDELKGYLADPEEDKDLRTKDQEDLKKYEDLKKLTELYAQYRAIYFDPFVNALPSEEPASDISGAIQLKALNTNNYTITTHNYGVGEFVEKSGVYEFVGTADPNFKCEWKEDLKQIILYRTDGKVVDGNAYCSYSITSNQDSSVTSTGLITASFINIAPIAKNDTYSITPSSNSALSVNPLSNDSDDGDGPTTHLTISKTTFYKNEQGVELPIRLSSIPAGLIVNADRKGPCPGNYIKDTCYGGQLYFEVKNNFSQFDYELEYNIFDTEGISSNNAKIYLLNTEKNTNNEASGGGGSLGIYSVLGLAGLALFRNRRKK
ncbi:hypothetical protein B9T26_09350 [Acinetobacter sp. ANC 4169]|uniref:CSLREA domain-containing protein n=1 Tax=Acinetobacter sp. ANC 4169 TaxID=1977879 RepID=UPI000A33EEF9|nr:CSLREA domain-containing protein [Acinetobacter sp. ANC 4169]OTG73281.1 hypothetical protein B9T26_09350 [Acinetobacter sp. ANC 4169]